ncbi:MAG: hypothetical protein AAF152_09680 [Cyanobacteria bacterium P01_A01_bin.114]
MRYCSRSLGLKLAYLVFIGVSAGVTSCRPGPFEGVFIPNDEGAASPTSDEPISQRIDEHLSDDPAPADKPPPEHLLAPDDLANSSLNSLLMEKTPPPEQSLHPLEQEQISINGLGPIRVGMTLEAASQAAGTEFMTTSEAQTVCRYYQPTDEAIKGLRLMVIDSKVIRLDIWPGSPVTTLSGIGIGSTEAEIRASYPEQLEEMPHEYTPGKYLIFTSPGDIRNLYRLVFETDENGIVTQYRAGQFPAVTWIEGCS